MRIIDVIIYCQSIYGDASYASHELFLDDPPCSCTLEPICQSDWGFDHAKTTSYEGIFYSGGNPSIAQKDPMTCEWSWVTPQWSTQTYAGLVTTGDGLFYAIDWGGSNAVYEIDINNDNYSVIGNTPSR